MRELNMNTAMIKPYGNKGRYVSKYYKKYLMTHLFGASGHKGLSKRRVKLLNNKIFKINDCSKLSDELEYIQI